MFIILKVQIADRGLRGGAARHVLEGRGLRRCGLGEREEAPGEIRLVTERARSGGRGGTDERDEPA